MISVSGSLKGKRKSPYLYVIVKSYCMYIGETQQHPVLRWGQHLCQCGSFVSRLREADEDVWARDEDIFFYCLYCNRIAQTSDEEHKIITQYIEHKVHELCILNLSELYPVERIISDTEKTAPARCRYQWGDDLARAIYEKIAQQIKIWSSKSN